MLTHQRFVNQNLSYGDQMPEYHIQAPLKSSRLTKSFTSGDEQETKLSSLYDIIDSYKNKKPLNSKQVSFNNLIFE